MPQEVRCAVISHMFDSNVGSWVDEYFRTFEAVFMPGYPNCAPERYCSSNRCIPSLCVLALHLSSSDLDPAAVIPTNEEQMLIGEDLTATCGASSSLETSTVWYKVSADQVDYL